MPSDLPPGDLARPFWAAAARGELVAQVCGDCGHTGLLARPVCSACLGERLHWEPVPPEGDVEGTTVVHRPPSRAVEPGYQLALVRLDAGPRLLTRVAGDRVVIGGRVTISFGDEDGEGRRTPLSHAR
jgi:uncharacterized protein